MIIKRGRLALTLAVISSLFGCGCGGGGGGGTNPDDPSDPGNQNITTLDITVNGLATLLDVTWMGQTVTMSPEKLTAQLQTTSTNISDPEYQSPEHQNCDPHVFSKNNDSHSLEINCEEPDTLRLVATASGLKGELKFSWNGQELMLSEALPIRAVDANLAEFPQPAITAQPELQHCTEEPIIAPNTGSNRIYNYKIACTDELAKHRIELDNPLPYPVSLSAGAQSLSVKTETSTFSEASSRLDGVTINNPGGTQQCTLEQGEYSIDTGEQSWKLSCREYLVVTNGMQGESGVYVIYSDGEQMLLQSEAAAAAEVKTLAAGQSQIVVHPDFGIKTLDFAEQGTVWTSMDGLPAGEVLESLVTDAAIYTNYALSNPSGTERYHILRIDRDSNRSRLIVENDIGAQPYLIPVSAREDTMAFYAMTDTNDIAEQVFLSSGGDLRDSAIAIKSRAGVQVAEYDANNWFLTNLFHSGNLTLDFIFNSGSTKQLASLDDLDTQILTWYDTSGTKRILGLGYDLLDSGVFGERRLAELDVNEDGSLYWKAPADFPTEFYGYMGADGKTLAFTANESASENQLVTLFTQQGRVDLEDLGNKAGFQLPLRVQPSVSEFDFIEVKPVNGWILLFEGQDESGRVWVTDGRAEHTWEIPVSQGVSWEAFNENYTLVAAGANMVAVSYLDGEERKLFLHSNEFPE